MTKLYSKPTKDPEFTQRSPQLQSSSPKQLPLKSVILAHSGRTSMKSIHKMNSSCIRGPRTSHVTCTHMIREVLQLNGARTYDAAI